MAAEVEKNGFSLSRSGKEMPIAAGPPLENNIDSKITFDITSSIYFDKNEIIKCPCCSDQDCVSLQSTSPVKNGKEKPKACPPPPPTAAPSVIHPLPRREQQLRDEAKTSNVCSFRLSHPSVRSLASRQESFRSFRSDVDETDLDDLSQYSLFMKTDFRYYLQHPYSRLIVAYLVTFCNFLIYAEDPVAHSEKDCMIPVIGNMFAFVCTRYPPNAWSVLKVTLWMLAIVAGLVFGKSVVHKLLFSK